MAFARPFCKSNHIYLRTELINKLIKYNKDDRKQDT